MSRVARKFLSGAVMSAVAMAGLLVSPAEAAACLTLADATCALGNGYGGELSGSNDVEYDDGGCVVQWDCEYDDGTQIRHLVLD